MNAQQDEPMEAELRALLKTVTAQADPDDVRLVEARVWSKLAAALPGLPGLTAGPAPHAAQHSGSTVNPTAVSGTLAPLTAPTGAVLSAKAVAVLAAVFVLGSGVGAWVARATVAPRVVYLDRAAPVAPTLAADFAPAIAPAPVTVLQSARAASATPATGAHTDPPRSVPVAEGASRTAPPLASAQAPAASAANGERQLIDAARTEFSRGYPADCLIALDRHRDRYPAGALREEREALAVRALAALGRTAEAQTRGARFLATYPQSLMRVAVEAAMEMDAGAP